ncbi:MAG: hypothetical protein AB3N63_12525 [Puniceicoccaceae bacterium]
MNILRALILFTLLFSGLHSEEIVRKIERHIRPGAQGTPTPVDFSVYIIDVLDISDVERTVTVDYIWLMMWNDPRLADGNYEGIKNKLDMTLDDIWHPHVSQVNLKSAQINDRILNVDSDGNVAYRVRQKDTFTVPLNLHRFPFDEQSISLKFMSTHYGQGEISLQWNQERSGYLGDFSIPGWTFKSVSHKPTVMTMKGGNRDLFGIDLQIHLERNSGFYVWKVFVPLSLIVFMAWSVFWIDPANFAGQVAISTSSVITLIAFQLSLTQLLPKISYLTEIDIFVLATSILVFLALGEAIFTARLAKSGKHDISLNIDRWMRYLYPVFFVILLLFVIF